jgi:DNA-binding response OmpR family regulator
MKILLAEDDDALRNAFLRTLGRLGHEVEAFPSGERLCETLRAGAHADLVWTDLLMPDGDGFTVIRCAHDMLPGAVILVVSGHGDSEHVLRAVRLGADHFLPKPVEPSELAAMLRRIETIRNVYRDKVRAWNSFVRCEVELAIPPDLGVAAAAASLVGKHARSFLDEAGCRGLQTAAHEILLNAIEHGCLEITREEKLDALAHERFSELLAARRADPRLAARAVAVRLSAGPGEGVTLTVTGPGPGFDPTSLPDPSDPENLFLPSGRGIIMAKLHVDELRYEDGGRTAVLHARGKPAA